MTKIKAIEPVDAGIVNVQDVYVTLDGLSGNYRSRDLYDRYRSAAQANGRTPGSINLFSRELTRLGMQRFMARNQAMWTIRQTGVLANIARDLEVG